MCGIAGFIDERVSCAEGLKTLGQMLESTHHRGPDNTGEWQQESVYLGHNRLSIIDLSEHGHQPMHRNHLVLTFNGEIYNYLEIADELRKAGLRFESKSDSEVILAAYEHWGESCVEHFVGMWAFVIWDKAKKRLFCSRDRFGIKPFNFVSQDGRFYFSSEFKALKFAPIFSNQPNEAHLKRFLMMGWNVYKDETHFKCIQALEPAHNLIYQDGKFEIKRYWDVDLNRKSSLSTADRLEAFRAAFLRSIKIHMRADVEVGGCLSGGIDSSAIAGSVATLFPDKPFKTFTIYYPGKGEIDERPWSKAVTDAYPSLVPFYRNPAGDEIAEIYDQMAWNFDTPLSGSSPISQYFVMQLAKSHGMKVLLDGQGSDEYLGGYLHSFYRLSAEAVRTGKFLKAVKLLTHHKNHQSMSNKWFLSTLMKSALASVMGEQQFFSTEYKQKFPRIIRKERNDVPFQFKDEIKNKFHQFLYTLTFKTTLPNLLHNEDRNSMAFSIESRVPFLDHRLVEMAFSYPIEDKINHSVTKYMLRESLRGIIPDQIANRRDKQGFVTPGEVKWLRGPLSGLMNFKPDFLDFLDPRQIKTQIDRYEAGDNSQARLIWRLASLNHWSKKNL